VVAFYCHIFPFDWPCVIDDRGAGAFGDPFKKKHL